MRLIFVHQDMQEVEVLYLVLDSARTKHIEFCFVNDQLFVLSAWTWGKFTEGKLYLIDYYHKQKESCLFIKSYGNFLGTSRPYIEVSVSLI